MSCNSTGARTRRDRAHFDATADTLRAKDLAPASQRARRHRLLQSLRPLALDVPPRVLEVGCGAGFSARYLGRRYRSYLGIDHSETLIAVARSENGGPGIDFEAADAASFASDERFDVILMIGVLHHLERPAAVLRHLVESLVPGGFVVANEPHPANPLISLARRIRARNDPSYSSEQEEIPRSRLHELLAEAGLADIRVIPQGLLSTPFAEVVIGPQWLTRHLSSAACLMDRALENSLGRLLLPFTWNLIGIGQIAGESVND